jgi:hypothetical protein
MKIIEQKVTSPKPTSREPAAIFANVHDRARHAAIIILPLPDNKLIEH